MHVSRIVVISGAAMIAGSSPIFFARRGRIHPIHFAIITTAIIVIPRAITTSVIEDNEDGGTIEGEDP